MIGFTWESPTGRLPDSHERGTEMATTTGTPAKASTSAVDLADHGKFAEIASRRVSSLLADFDTIIKLGRTRGVAMTAADKEKVLKAVDAKRAELDRTWTPGTNAKVAKTNGFAL